MKLRSVFVGAVSGFITCAVTQTAARAASSTIEAIATFSYPDNGVETFGFGINNNGEIGGRFHFLQGRVQWQGLVRAQDGAYSIITVPSAGAPFTTVSAINDSGVTAGYYKQHDTFHGFIKPDETYTSFDLPQAVNTYINALNNAGDFAGTGYYADGSARGFINAGGNVTYVDIPISTYAQVSGLNNLGQAVGVYNNHGFFRDADGTLIFPIDYPGAIATAVLGINDKGWMVGYYLDSDYVAHGFFPARRCISSPMTSRRPGRQF